MPHALQMFSGVVVSTADPQGLGRLQLRVDGASPGGPGPALGWARVATTPLGPTCVLTPAFAPGDSVLFAAAKPPLEGAIVLGLIGGRPVADGAAMHSVTLALGQGQQATIEAGAGGLRVSTSAGQQIALQADGDVSVASPGRVVVSAAEVQVTAGSITADAALTRFSGVVQCDTLIASNVVASSYTPGAGNTW